MTFLPIQPTMSKIIYDGETYFKVSSAKVFFEGRDYRTYLWANWKPSSKQ